MNKSANAKSDRIQNWLAAGGAGTMLVGLVEAIHFGPWSSIYLCIGGVLWVSALVRSTSSRYTNEAPKNDIPSQTWRGKMPVTWWMTDREFTIISCDGGGLHELGLSQHAILGKSVFEVFGSEEDLIPAMAIHRQALTGAVGTFELHWRGHLVKMRVAPAFNDSGDICGVEAFGMVAAGVMEPDELRREMHQRFMMLFQASPDAIVVKNLEGRVVDANPAACRLFGRTLDELSGMHIRQLVPPGIADAVEDDFQTLGAEGPDHYTTFCQTPDGTEIPVELRAVRTRYLGKPALLVHMRDISARRSVEKKLEEANQQVIQQERLRALGQMASGIAHEFNNALTSILGYSDILASDEKARSNTSQTKEYAETISMVARDAAHVVRRMSQFYRQRQSDIREVTSFDMNELVQEVIKLTQPKWQAQARALGKTIEVVPHLKVCPTIEGNQTELREMLTNLIFNAVDALEEDGQVTIATRVRNNMLEMKVIDNGSGMDDETLKKCCEPFYTTKKERGTGLGLSIVYGIVQRHGGEIQFASRRFKGTTITITLPIKIEQLDLPQSNDMDFEKVSPKRIVVIDDEPNVRAVMRYMLHCDEHKVIDFNSTMEALEYVLANPVDLVITDLSMPGINGEKLIRMIKARKPELPVLLVSGFRDHLEELAKEETLVDAFIAKPFTLADVRAAMRNVFVAPVRPKKPGTDTENNRRSALLSS